MVQEKELRLREGMRVLGEERGGGAVVQEKELRLREGMRVLGEEQGGWAVLSVQDHVIANTWVGAEGPVHDQRMNGISCGCTQPVTCFASLTAGLDDLSFWTSWAVTHWSTLAASGLLCTAMCAYPFPSSSLLLLALFFMLLAAALVSFRSVRMCAPSALFLIHSISPSHSPDAASFCPHCSQPPRLRPSFASSPPLLP